MKKTLSLCMALIMLCSLCTTAFAATITEDGTQSGTTTVTYGVEMSYVVTVPDSVTIDTETLSGTAEVAVSDVMLSNKYQLGVTLNSDFTLTDAANASNTLGYTVKNNGTAIANGDVVLSVKSGETDGASTTLTLSLNSAPTKAGTYSDVMTFGVSVYSSIITFTYAQTTTWSSTPIERQFEVGMTWGEFIASDYNAIADTLFWGTYYIRGQFMLDGEYVYFKGYRTDLGETDYWTIPVAIRGDDYVKSSDTIDASIKYDSTTNTDGGSN